MVALVEQQGGVCSPEVLSVSYYRNKIKGPWAPQKALGPFSF